MTVTQFSERADLIADTTYYYTVDIGNYKVFGLNQLRSVATVFAQHSTRDIVTLNRIQARAGGPVDRILMCYVPPVYEIYPLGFSLRCAYPATGIVQRRERSVSCGRSMESVANAVADGGLII